MTAGSLREGLYCEDHPSVRIAGQAFTYRICDGCGETVTYSSTATDPYCVACSKKLKVCKQCGKSLD